MITLRFQESKLFAVSACIALLLVCSLVSVEDHVRSTRSLQGLILDSTNAFHSEKGSLDPSNPRAIPKGESPYLPSIRVPVEEVQGRNIYGGKGDKQHLGGEPTNNASEIRRHASFVSGHLSDHVFALMGRHRIHGY